MTSKPAEAADPFTAVYEAMTPEEKTEHIQGHPAMVVAWVEQYEKNSRFVVDLRAEKYWAEAFFYRARIVCCSSTFAIDRRHTIKRQCDLLEYYIGTLQAEHELHEILNRHGSLEK